MLITCGTSASGKSTIAKQLCASLNLIMISSDRERKRQANINLQTNCTAPVLTGLYHPETNQKDLYRFISNSKNNHLCRLSSNH